MEVNAKNNQLEKLEALYEDFQDLLNQFVLISLLPRYEGGSPA
jgi:hypothetical protein